jgi:hypothetical protein
MSELPYQDCGLATNPWTNPGHFYMLHDSLWHSIVPGGAGTLLWGVPSGGLADRSTLMISG